MTILDAITRCDALRHNTFSRGEKLRWLSTLDKLIHEMIHGNREDSDPGIFPGYDDQTDLNRELLVPHPFDEVYLRWLESRIDYHNGELERYNNSNAMFQAAYDRYRSHYNRSHMPLRQCFRFF